ncbi:MAG: ribonuclease J [Patescibacteria group bacterium]
MKQKQSNNFTDATDELLKTTPSKTKKKPRRQTSAKAKKQSTSRGKITHTNKRTSKRSVNKSRSRSTSPKRSTRKGTRSRTTRTKIEGLRIMPFGGQEEVGRNMTVFEMGNDIVILDMGLQFPEEDMPGIDYIIPNISYLKGKEKNIRAVIFSHGHLDHIGAAPILLEQLGYPLVIGSDLTLALVKNRVEDYKKGAVKKLKTLTLKDLSRSIPLGSFTAKFFAVEHSIADAVGLILETKEGSVVHPGDWTLEKNPSPGKQIITYEHLKDVKRPSVLMLESLGINYSKDRVPEATMMKNLKMLVDEAPGRIIIGTFSSQVERIKQLIEYAGTIGKKVALDGYSMKLNVKVSQELGYIKPAKNTLIPVDKIGDHPDNKVIVICTGAQGESNAVLSRIIAGNHKSIKIQREDTIVFSSSVIPGNERSIQRLKDNLYRLCDNVIHSDIMDVHSGGHSTKKDIQEVLHQIKPDYFLPVYANHYMLKETQKLAVREGWDKEKVPVLDNGSIFALKDKKAKVIHGTINTDYVFVDGLGIGDVSNVVLRDRQVMASDGMLVVIATVDGKHGNLVSNPDLISRGFIYMKENKKLVEDTRKKTIELLKDEDPRTAAQQAYIKEKIRNELGKYLFQKTQRRPMILPVIIEV